MVRWHFCFNGHDYDEQTPGDIEGRGNLACCSPPHPSVRHYLVTEQQQQRKKSKMGKQVNRERGGSGKTGLI